MRFLKQIESLAENHIDENLLGHEGYEPDQAVEMQED